MMYALKNKLDFTLSLERFEKYVLVLVAVAVLTGIMLLIGRATLGEGVIALLYLLPIGWSTVRWGQGPGFTAAVAAALSFDFFFIPPFFTFTVGSLEGWLILLIFSLVAVVIVGQIQSVLSQAERREREAIFMYEMNVKLADITTSEGVAYALAEKLQQLYLADIVQVMVEQKAPHQTFLITLPPGRASNDRPDRVIPMLGSHGLQGEICLWQGAIRLPSAGDLLLQRFAAQGAHALQRISSDREKI